MLLASSDWVAVANIATPVVCTAVGFLIKRALADMDGRIARVEKRVDEDEQAQQCYVGQHRDEHSKLAENVVKPEEWLRESGRMRGQLDELNRNVAKLGGQNEMGTQIAAGVATALKTAARERENERNG